MKKLFIFSSLLSLLLVGCGSSGGDSNNGVQNLSPSNRNSNNNDNNSNRESIKQEIRNHDEIAIIYRASDSFCENNSVLEFVKKSAKVSTYGVYTTDETVECADFGKNSNTCDTFVAEGEPGSITCIIAINLR